MAFNCSVTLFFDDLLFPWKTNIFAVTSFSHGNHVGFDRTHQAYSGYFSPNSNKYSFIPNFVQNQVLYKNMKINIIYM